MESLNDVAASLRRVDVRIDALEERLDYQASAARLPSPCGCDDAPTLYTRAELNAAANGGIIVGALLVYVLARYVVPLFTGDDQ